MAEAKVSMEIPWQEGSEDDFEDLRKAIQESKAQKYENKTKEEIMDEDAFATNYGLVEEDLPEPPKHEKGARLLWAAQQDNLDVLKEILDENPDLVSYQDSDGYTALHRACYANHRNVAQMLIFQYKANIHATTKDLWTPLCSAAHWNSADCVDLLLQEGADVNHKTNGSQTPLHLALSQAYPRDTLEVLFMCPNLDTSVRNSQNDRAKDIALRKGHCVDFFDLTMDGARNKIQL